MGEKQIPFKVCLIKSDSEESETRRLGVAEPLAKNFSYVTEKISEIFFPKLDKKLFTVYWIDKDDDNILVSSDQEFEIAVDEMLMDIKKVKLYIKVTASESIKKDKDSDMLHPSVFCDGCDGAVVGFRYKCLVCKNYDLCSTCEQKLTHSEHIMLRVPNPYISDHINLQKLVYCLSSFLFSKAEEGKCHSYYRRKHSHDIGIKDFCKKKRKCDKYELNAEPDEIDDFAKSFGKKKKHCVCNLLYNDFLGDFDSKLQADNTKKPQPGKKSEEEAKEDFSHVTFFKNMGKTLNALLNPMGVDVDFEVRTKNDEKKEAKTAEKKEGTSSNTVEKEVPTPEGKKDAVNEIVEEISKTLANQKLNESSEKGDWVSFEELNRDSCESEASNSDPSKENPGESSTSKESANLYPKLNDEPKPSNPLILSALEMMLSMGFTNEGGWLTSLLENKNGDINQALEVLTPHKKT